MTAFLVDELVFLVLAYCLCEYIVASHPELSLCQPDFGCSRNDAKEERK